MITSLFSKSKPINYLIVVVLIILLFVSVNYNAIRFSLNSALIELTKLIILIVSVVLLSFIVTKNNLTQKNSYAILTFTFLFALFSEALSNLDLLFSNLSVLLALRRIISLHTATNTKKKLFEAAFWIALATLFYFWALLYFAVLLVALLYYAQNSTKNSIIPFVGIAAVSVLLISYNIVVFNQYILPSNFNTQTRFNYTTYNNLESIIKLTTLFALFIWVFIYYLKPSEHKKLKPSYFLISCTSAIAILIGIIAPVKSGSEFIFLFFPFSILMANYIEIITEHWFKEVFVTAFILVALVCLLL
ncbi:MAG: DUF6427 family protein [Winogradskyella sp.]